MEEFAHSFKDWWKDRTTSPVWGFFISAFIMWNWKILYTLFLSDEQSSLNIEYIIKNFYLLPESGSWQPVVNKLWIIVPPAAIATLLMFVMPYIHQWAYNITIKAYFSRRRVKDAEQLSYERDKGEQLKALALVKTTQVLASTKIKEREDAMKESLTSEERWELEYGDFEKNALFYTFGELLKIIYSTGNTRLHGDDRAQQRNMAAYAEAHNLITIHKDNENRALVRVQLTEKGKLFARKYLERNPIT